MGRLRKRLDRIENKATATVADYQALARNADELVDDARAFLADVTDGISIRLVRNGLKFKLKIEVEESEVSDE